FQTTRELRGGRGFPRTLQTNHHDDGGRNAAQLESFAPLAEHGGELVIDDLDELLRGRDGAQLRDADGLLLDALEKFARELEVDVGLEEDAPDFTQSFFDIGFVEDAASTQTRKRRLEFFTELVKHNPKT